MHSKRDGFEILQNVQFLGRSGVVVFPDGLRVAFLSGKDNDLFEKVTGVSFEIDSFRKQLKINRMQITIQETTLQMMTFKKLWMIMIVSLRMIVSIKELIYLYAVNGL